MALWIPEAWRSLKIKQIAVIKAKNHYMLCRPSTIAWELPNGLLRGITALRGDDITGCPPVA